MSVHDGVCLRRAPAEGSAGTSRSEVSSSKVSGVTSSAWEIESVPVEQDRDNDRGLILGDRKATRKATASRTTAPRCQEQRSHCVKNRDPSVSKW